MVSVSLSWGCGWHKGSSPWRHNTPHCPITFHLEALHSGSHMHRYPCAYRHNVPRRLKEGENSASSLHRTKNKNSFTLKLAKKKFQNHMHKLNKLKKKKESTADCWNWMFLFSLPSFPCQDHYPCQNRDVSLLSAYYIQFNTTKSFCVGTDTPSPRQQGPNLCPIPGLRNSTSLSEPLKPESVLLVV